jgi:hypothetical protein
MRAGRTLDNVAASSTTIRYHRKITFSRVGSVTSKFVIGVGIIRCESGISFSSILIKLRRVDHTILSSLHQFPTITGNRLYSRDFLKYFNLDESRDLKKRRFAKILASQGDSRYHCTLQCPLCRSTTTRQSCNDRGGRTCWRSICRRSLESIVEKKAAAIQIQDEEKEVILFTFRLGLQAPI